MKRFTPLFWLQLALTILCCGFLIIPVFQSILAGITVNYIQGLESGLTLRWIWEMWDLYAETIFRSLNIASLCLILSILIGVPASYFLARHQNRLTRVLEELLVLPLAVPGLAIALGILVNYGGLTHFRQSIFFILAGHVLFTLPFMVRSVTAVLAMIDLKELEEGAASLGAGFRRRFFGVVLPQAMPGILTGALMVFTLSVGEFNLTWMLHTPLNKTLPVGLADSYASMRLEIGSAYTLAFFFMIVPFLTLLQWMTSPGRPQKKVKETKTVQEFPAMTRQQKSEFFSPTSIRLKHCGKTFPDGTQALFPLDLSIEPGQTVVFLGPSGCGKTTTLRLVAGLEQPDSGGRVYFDDEDVTALPIEKRNVGMVFQNYALFSHMTVAQNVAYGLKVRGMDASARNDRVREMLEMMRIPDLADRRVNQLSGGQKQRVALARALAVRPKVLLLDEPLTALDAKLRETLRVEIDTLLKSLGITAIYVTHDQTEAMAIGDLVVVMDQGRIIQSGAPRDIYFKPKDRFVADFIGVFSRLRCHRNNGRLLIAGTELETEAFVDPKSIQGKSEVDLYFRPESARINSQGTIPGEVSASMFLGDKVRVQVRLPDGQVCQVDAPGSSRFKAGDKVSLTIDPSSILAL